MSEVSDDYKDLKKLKQYLEDNFCFYGLKQAGFFKGIDKNDYVKQAERIRKFFSLESIYHYSYIPPVKLPKSHLFKPLKAKNIFSEN